MSDNLNQSIAFFDLDLTITDRDTFKIFLLKYYLQSFSKLHYAIYIFFYVLLRKFRLISLQSLKEKALIGLKKKSKVEILSIGKQLFDSSLINYIRPKAIEQINKHKNNGDLIYIISASPDIYLKAFASFLNCDGYFCTELKYKDNTFTGQFNGLDCIGKEKLRIIKDNINILKFNNIFVYSDHHSDIPLLEISNNPIAVNPTGELLNYSKNNKWETVIW